MALKVCGATQSICTRRVLTALIETSYFDGPASSIVYEKAFKKYGTSHSRAFSNGMDALGLQVASGSWISFQTTSTIQTDRAIYQH